MEVREPCEISGNALLTHDLDWYGLRYPVLWVLATWDAHRFIAGQSRELKQHCFDELKDIEMYLGVEA